MRRLPLPAVFRLLRLQEIHPPQPLHRRVCGSQVHHLQRSGSHPLRRLLFHFARLIKDHPPAASPVYSAQRRIRKNPTSKQSNRKSLSFSLPILFLIFDTNSFPFGHFSTSKKIHPLETFWVVFSAPSNPFFYHKIIFHHITWRFSVCLLMGSFECNSFPIERKQDVKSCLQLYFVVLYITYSVRPVRHFLG